jgi:hypothetical protein
MRYPFLEVNFLDKNDFDKGDLKDELKNAGFEDCIADDIADRVDDRKMDNWTSDNGRNEALREIDMLITRTRQAYDNFRNRNMSSTSTMNSSNMSSSSMSSNRDVM